MGNPETRAFGPQADDEKRAADFELDRRLVEHLVANAISDNGPAVMRHNPSIMSQWLALVAIIPLLALAWLYSAMFDRAK
jgi:hypothetical protein